MPFLFIKHSIVMKSQKYLFTILILLSVLAVILVLKNQKSTIPAGMRNIAVTNTNDIDRIIIRSGTDEILLEKEGQVWRLNNAFVAKKTAIDLVLNMLQRLEIVAPLPLSYHHIAARKLENTGNHVRIFCGNRTIRSFFIDYDTAEVHGTIYMKEGSRTPFFLKLKGHSLSDISLLFSPRIRFWRDNKLFSYRPSDISRIRIDYPHHPSRSFEMIIRADNQPELIKTVTGEKLQELDNKSIMDYLYFFSGISYHLTETDSIPALVNQLHIADIRITDDTNTPVQLKLYRKPASLTAPDNQHVDLNWCYGKIDDEEEIISIKYVDIDPILRELDDFLKK